jgi:alkaline phosphatase D
MKRPISRRRFAKVTVVSVTGLAIGCAEVGSASLEPVNISDATVDAAASDGDAGALVDGGGSDATLDTALDVGPTDVGHPDTADTAASDTEDTTEPPDPTLFDPGDLEEDVTSFPLAVQAGGAEQDGALLWTLYEGSADLDIVIFLPTEGQGGDLVISAEVEIADSGVVHVVAEGLAAWTVYQFCFVERGVSAPKRSAVGRFRTRPTDDALEVISFGGTSCVNGYYSPHNTLSRAGEDAFDFFILAGDTLYADGAFFLEEFRSSWRTALADPGYRDLLTTTSTLATWDDHEITNNWDPEFIDAALVEAGTAAFFEHLPLPRIEEAPDRIWRSSRWGKTLEVFVLDCRGERMPSTRQTAIAQYISPEQMAWLKEGLSASPCHFKVLVNSVPITNFPPLVISESDRWEGYPVQRDEILGYIHDEGLTGVVWLTGDFHFGAMTRVEPPPHPWSDQREVLMGPGDQFINPTWLTLGLGDGEQQFSAAIGQVNFTRFTADPTGLNPTLTIEFISADGDVLHAEAIAVE